MHGRRRRSRRLLRLLLLKVFTAAPAPVDDVGAEESAAVLMMPLVRQRWRQPETAVEMLSVLK